MKNADETYIVIGKLGSAYGVRGWMKMQTFTDYGAQALDYQPWFIANQSEQWEELAVEEGRMQANGILLVKLASIDSPEEAKLLAGKTIAIRRSQLPTLGKNEYYWSDLVGLTVINKNGTVLGKVTYLLETGANDVLVVKGEKEQAIPYLPGTVVLNIDLDKQEILVDWELI